MSEELYEKGIAVGMSNIANDCLEFRFRDELFTVPAEILFSNPPIATHNGYFYTARVSHLRALQEKMNGRKRA